MPTSPDTRVPDTHQDVWKFADCEFDDVRYELRVCGRPVEMERKPLDLLRYLLSRSGAVVKKEKLLEEVWPGVLVVDASLATAVSKLRKAFGDQEVIQTVPRVGYRIAVPVVRVSRPDATENLVESDAGETANESSLSIETQKDDRPRLGKRLLWGGVAVALVAAFLIGGVISRVRKTATPQPVSLAILPFQNDSGMQSMDYLRSALPDEIAHTLTAARSLALRPLTASAQFSGPTVDFRKVGHVLDVNRVVTGHFRILGDRLHITMEAVDTDADRVVWHDSFEVPSTNLLAMQEQIAAISRGRMARALGVQEFITDAPPKASNEEAYELYLKSVALDWDPNPNKEGIELLRRAVLLDPNYAPAWGLLTLRYYSAARFGGGGPEMLAFSDAAAEKELALNPDSLDPLAEMTIHRTERGDLVKAHQMALELVRRRPDDPNLHHVLSYVLRYGGSLEEAGHECEMVVLLASKVIWGSCSTTFMELGNYKRAMFFLRKDLGSEWSKAHAIEVLLREGRTEEAIRIPAPQIAHWDSYTMLLACARHASESEIKALASKVEVDDDPEVDYFFAGHLAYCGQTKAALRMLKVAIDHNYCSYPAMDTDPFFKDLRANAEFQKLRQAGKACHADFMSDREVSHVAPDQARMKHPSVAPVEQHRTQ
ncbi:winged helix-turn-helix domain-containing protein [Telmatobacter sp. DSM 110680]|uniref:Winged helix-turn-helix domain-containing protein n=1 Tax=Telmatobacter sp. DSM 110680 TaxID=3036704 RepID=A0AAU7DLC8_9BACT